MSLLPIREIKYSTEATRKTRGIQKCAFPSGCDTHFELHIPAAEQAKSVTMCISDEKGRPCIERSMQCIPTDGTYEVYTVSLDPMTELPLSYGRGLFYYVYRVESESTYFLAAADDAPVLEKSEHSHKKTQLLYYVKDNHPESPIVGGTMYHIFVDRFCRSGKSQPCEGTILNPDWENGIPQYAKKPGDPVDNNMFFGGDLWGVAEKLDYIASLNVNCIYLSPIFKAASNHKYDTSDYLRVDEAFGGDEALKHLVEEAKKRGISVILDGVFNHTGADSLYFNKFGKFGDGGAYHSTESPYYKWYTFRKYPDEYECWWGVTILPRVRADEPSYRHFIYDEVVPKWMSFGIAGFRLDVADELSDHFLSGFSWKVKGLRSDAVIYGEVWEDASNKIAYDERKRYFQGGELDSVMNYPLRDALIAYLRDGDDRAMRAVLIMLYGHYPTRSANLLMNLLGTHDTERILTRLAGDDFRNPLNEELATKRLSAEARQRGITQLKLAYAVAATVPGVPCIYYGDEAGMEGYRDPFNRMPYPWGKEETELVAWYRKFGALRREHTVFAHGDIDLHVCTPDILAYSRFEGNQSVLVVINRSDCAYELATGADLIYLFGTESTGDMQLPPMSASIYSYTGEYEFSFFKK